MMKIVLASNSPRRRELLRGLGVSFEVRVQENIDETYPQNMPAEQIPLYISRHKAEAYDVADNELLITADTIVTLDGEIMGKPHSEGEAHEMLQRLSGRTHEVITGVTLRGHVVESISKESCDVYSFSTVTKVTFATLTPKQIDYYVANFHPLDKAGAYGIQEWIGYVGVIGIEGSYYNVMGLPIQRLATVLSLLGVDCMEMHEQQRL